MIFYFTGTGNSRWVAEQLSALLGDEAVDIATCLHTEETPAVKDTIGVVFPVHSWMPPRPVMQFLSHLSVPDGTYRYAVCTCGDDAGKAMTHLSHSFHLDAAWSVFMPNTYVPMFQLDTDEVAAKKIDAARKLMPEIAQSVAARASVWKVYEGSFPRVKSYVINPLFLRFYIRPQKFHVDKGCTSCGVCVRLCPMANVCLVDGHPVWGRNCIHCMACLHGCPVGVIQYGNSTQKKGRYRLNRYL